MSIFNENGKKMKLVNEFVGNMARDTWYLLPQAYSLTLKKKYPYRQWNGWNWVSDPLIRK